MNNNSKREINFFSRWRVTRYPKATFTPLELGKYADCTKPVFCPFLNHWINFWIVMRVFRAHLGLICVRQIQVWPSLCTIFQQIYLRHECSIWVSAILTPLQNLVQTLRSRTPLSVSSTPNKVSAILYLANFSAIPCETCSWKIEIFSDTVKFSSLIRGDL